MATVKSFNTLLAEFKSFLRQYNRSLDTSDTSLARDLLLFPYAIGTQAVMQQVGIARDLHVLSKIKGDQLDDEATNYGLERSQGEYSTVTLTFYTAIAPTSDISIPAGTQAKTTGTSYTSPKIFTTLATTTISTSNVSSYYSYDNSRYEFEVQAVAEEIGEASNVGSGFINSLVTSVSGIQGVTNLIAASGGAGVEDDDDFRERIRVAKTGRDLNTINGFRTYLQNSGFIDAYPVRVEDSDSERASGVDAFVIDNSLTSITETFTYTHATQRYYFTYRPIRSVTSVVSGSAGTLSSSDYDVYTDSTTPMRRSVNSQDYIEIRPSASLPDQTPFQVTYTYSSNIRTIQNQLELESNNILTADPLVKRAYPVSFRINATLTLFANTDGPATRNSCRNALIQFLAGYRLGDNVQKSDLVIVLQQGYGDFPVDSVDAVVINSYYGTDEFGNSYTPVDEVITIGNKYYVVYGSATIT